MRINFRIMILVVMIGCACAPTTSDIRAYGEKRFIEHMLAVADGMRPSSSLIETFKPIRAEPRLNGAWMLFHKSSRYEAGVYVDRKSLVGWGGSGMEVTPWSSTIAWTKENIRKSIKR